MSVGKRVRFEIFKRDGFTCQYCGQQPPDTVLEVDHIDPRANGGSDEEMNLITSCFDCNRGKSDKKLGDIHPRPDADLKFLEAQQELAEVRRYLAAAEQLDQARDLIIGRLEQLWSRDISPAYSPTQQQWKAWLGRFSPEEIQYAIEQTGHRFQSGQFGYSCGRGAVGQAIRYASGIMYRVRERASEAVQ